MPTIPSLRRLSVLCLVAAASALPLAAGDPLPLDRFEITLTPPPVTYDRSAADGSARVVLDGFHTRLAPKGAPDIPVRTLRVAIPEGAVPRLDVEVHGWRALAGPRPRAVPHRTHRLDAADEDRLRASRGDERTRLEVLAGASVEEPRPDRAFYVDGRSWPEQGVAWLGEIGRLRDQRYVVVHVAPVRWDGSSRRLVAASSLSLSVRFDGAEELAPAGSVAPSRFEDLYRQSFVNYQQGRLFRRAVPRAPRVARSKSAGSTASFKIFVRDNGVVRLDHAALDAAGVLAAGADPTRWRLTNRGQQVRMQVVQSGADPAVLEPGEWVEFYGQALDHEPKTRLNTDFPNADDDLFEVADFSDTNVYWLEPMAPGVQPAMVETDAAPACGGCAVPSGVVQTARFEDDSRYFPLGAADPWYWIDVLSADFGPTSQSIPLELPGLIPASPATLRLRIRGLTPYSQSADQAVDPDHTTRVTLRDDLGADLAFDEAMWDGRSLYDHSIVYAGASGPLTASATAFVEALPVPGAGNDVVVDFVEVDYERAFVAVGDRFEFDWPDGDAEFEVGGLSTLTDLQVWELSAPSLAGVRIASRLTNVEVLPGGAPYTVRFRIDDSFPDSRERRFVVHAGGGSVPAAADIVQDTPSTLRDTARQADMIVITHPDLLDLGAGPCIAPDPVGCLPELLAWRATAAGGGLSSTVALIDDVQDEFAFGLAGPDAIREFLRWVMSDAPGEGWADPKPSFLLLLGDGSFDYKAGTANGTFVPTQMMFRDRYEIGYYSSDNRLAAVVGDDELADLFVGRIPARSADDANRMLYKILDYEQAAQPGPWREQMLLIADRGHTGTEAFEAEAFRFINERGLAEVEGTPYQPTHLDYYLDYFTQMAPAAARQAMHDDIVAGVNADSMLGTGASVLQFAGHGNFYIWSDDSYWDERDLNPNVDNEFEFDTFELFNDRRLPMMMAHNCLTGGFHVTSEHSMGENWLRREGGGSVSVFAPSGLSFDFLGWRASEFVWGSMFGPTKERTLGPVAMSAIAGMCGQFSIEPCQHYVLLGDPATRLQIRSVAPATDVTTTSGHETVTLDWTASETPGATYDVYRFSLLANRLYFKANAAPVSGTTFVDSGLENAQQWWYHVVAVDADGFESRWSHFNSDCDVDGPDCLPGIALNPNPPAAPSNVRLTDLGVGSVLKVSWDQPSETDLAKYTLHWGTAPGDYTQSRDIGVGTSALLADLVPDQMYYLVVTATNTSQLTSAPSVEVAESPLDAFGFRPPAFIDTLTVRADAGDALLEWDEVATDAYGKPVSVAQYEILRGAAPDYSNAGLLPIATCAAPCGEYRDVGALGAASSYHYRVRAVDVDGYESGLGSEYPRWTFLEAGKVPGGDLTLSWDPVTTTIAGGPAQIRRYLVYAWDRPFTRQDVRDGIVPEPTPVDATTLQFTPDPASIYCSVLVEDVRGNMSPH